MHPLDGSGSRGGARLVTALLVVAVSTWPARPAADGLVRSATGPSRSATARPARDLRLDLAAVLATFDDGRTDALGGITPVERDELRELYPPGGAALWLDADGRPTRNMRDALAVLRDAAADGLDPADYFQDLLTTWSPRIDEAPPASAAAQFDVALSAATLRYLRDVHIGRIDPRTIGFHLDAPRDVHDFAVLLRGAMASQRVASLVADLRPHLAQYSALQSLLPHYRALTADPALHLPPAILRSAHPGDTYDGASTLEQTLRVLDDLPPGSPITRDLGRYDGALVDGVRHFQTRHGLEPDGLLGPSTIDALRVPIRWRVRQIELALERLRWLPHLVEGRLILLNIPMFRLWAWDAIPPEDAPRLGMDVIVGRALSTETPVFVAQMGEVVFRPYWNVPPSILRREVLRNIERDPGYLDREDMEIVRGQGDDAGVALSPDALAGLRAGRLRVRQRPGAKNALGPIKFVFPNRDDIYIHGTPAQALFARNRRDFSHGCVRVGDPVGLAEWVLEDRPEWTRDRIVAATTATATTHVKLPRPIQVILYYTTAAVMPEDGTIHFVSDIYRHDAKLDSALAGIHDVRMHPASRATTSRESR